MDGRPLPRPRPRPTGGGVLPPVVGLLRLGGIMPNASLTVWLILSIRLGIILLASGIGPITGGRKRPPPGNLGSGIPLPPIRGGGGGVLPPVIGGRRPGIRGILVPGALGPPAVPLPGGIGTFPPGISIGGVRGLGGVLPPKVLPPNPPRLGIGPDTVGGLRRGVGAGLGVFDAPV